MRPHETQAAYAGADRTLAAAWEAMPPDTVAFAASDHGFAPTWRAVYARASSRTPDSNPIRKIQTVWRPSASWQKPAGWAARR